MMLYEPSEDSYLLLKSLKNYSGNKALDIGTGTGIIAEGLIKNFKEVVAIDINPKAITFCKHKYSNIKFIVSDLFSEINAQFDLITFNAPYLPNDKVKDIALDGGLKGNELILRFLGDVRYYLKPKGKVLLLFSSLSSCKEILDQKMFNFKLVNSLKLDFEELFVYEISLKKILGEGKRGLVYEDKGIAVKVSNSKTNTLKFEAEVLKKINKLGIGPRFISFKENRLSMDVVKGIRIMDYLRVNSKKNILIVLKKVFNQLRSLDEHNIDKKEMNNPYKHIIVKGVNPVLIDFERARFSKHPQNITQFCQFLQSKKIKKILNKKKINIDFKDLPFKYKKNPSKKLFKQFYSFLQ